MPNLTWLYAGAIYAAAVALGRRAGADLPKRIAFFFFALIAHHGGPDTSVVINAAKGDSYEMHVTAPRHTLVASSITSWPGWHIRADGKNVSPLRINGAFLGFLLPPGEHEVRVWYAPWSFRIGIVVSLLTMIALAYVAWRPAARIGEPRHAVAAELR